MLTPDRPSSSQDVFRAALWGSVCAVLLLIGIYFGSGRFKYFDAALVPYTGATLFAAFGVGYRFAMWLRRPPTRFYWFAGWRIFFRPERLPRNVVRAAKLFLDDFVQQKFIEKRSFRRWAAHWLIAWGCILAAAVTFPLSFGWVHFQTAPDSQEIYYAFVFGQHVGTFRLGTWMAELSFNVLDIAAVMVIAGLTLALWRRARDRGAIAVQQFSQDMMPLMLLFSISITGLFLTASTHLMRGANYGFLSLVHAVTVIFTLLYLPFGKFFHIFQRPAQLGVQFFKDEGARTEQAACLRCGAAFASRLFVDGLTHIENALEIDYSVPAVGHYQQICPGCRRRAVAMAQDGLWRAQGTRVAAEGKL